jgi:restriction system protein
MTGLDTQRRGELLGAVFDVLADHPDGIPARDALAEVESRIELTEFEAANYPGSDIRRFEKTVRFQTINAVKAGWMVKEGGVWSPTEEGLEAHRAFPDPERFMVEAQKLYRVWAESRPPEPDDEEEAGELSDASVTLARAEEAAWREVREFLHEMDPYDFQRLVAGLLRGMGYHVPWVAPQGKDGGVDIVALSDPIGTKGPRVKVQVKRERRKTDVVSLRAFSSLLREGDIGLFVTLGGFTSDAEAEARQEVRRLRLIGAFELFELWTDHYEQIPEEDRRRLPVKFVPFLVPNNQDA